MSKATSKWEDPKILALRGGIGIILAYAFLTRAFSTGSYWHYLLAVVCAALGTRLLVRSFKTKHDKAS
jgi:hypothetical protein